MTIKLGDVVRDRISGFTGVVYGRFEYLYGCVRIQVNPKELKGGKPIEPQIFDEGQLELLGPDVEPASTKTGGPRSDDRLARR